MKNSKLAKRVLISLPLVVVIAVAALGLFLARDQRQTSVVTQAQAATPSAVQPTRPLPTERKSPLIQEQATPQLMILPDADPNTCISAQIYTTLPPKCINPEGKLIPVPGSDPGFFGVTPGK